MEELNDQLGMSFIIVTHDSKVALNADRILEMSDGKLFEK